MSTPPILINEPDEVTAKFTGFSRKNPEEDKKSTEDGSPHVSGGPPQVQTSPLLSSTPLTVSKALIRAYPYLIFANKGLSVLTWTDDNVFLPIALVLISVLTILYFESLVTYLGHMLPVSALSLFSMSCAYVETQQEQHATLDDVVHCLSTLGNKCERFLAPITSLNLTAYDLKRLLFTTVFLSPLYVLTSFFLLSPKAIICCATFFVLTYHSPWSRVTRRILWRSQTFRLLCFYLTGLDFEQQQHNAGKSTLFNYAVTRTNKKLREVTQKATGSGKNGPVRFTYVLYENQRRWLGIGWTPNLLSYERTPWTDEFLNEAESPDNFELPQLNDDSGMYWRWVDKTWRVDLTNDGAIQLPSTKSKTTADPKPDEGYIYYDNTWKSPATEDSFSKYTRRRRWVRTAELVTGGNAAGLQSAVDTTTDGLSIRKPSPIGDVQNVTATGDISTSAAATKKRKSLRFDTNPTVLGKDEENTEVKEGKVEKSQPEEEEIKPRDESEDDLTLLNEGKDRKIEEVKRRREHGKREQKRRDEERGKEATKEESKKDE
ncbi:DEKNAAC103365 [Brettanomyces naardenensis]|uniref:DEKNAAC103365 n=1 Tax=Brettanomyces naardenensis TaxID=13370 RepID=A0A448YN50_BRENA|nr:DEKNAAC103365 [Brettanomyces naardenensis]